MNWHRNEIDPDHAVQLDEAWDRFLDDPGAAGFDSPNGRIMADLHALGDLLDDPVPTATRMSPPAVTAETGTPAQQPWRIRRRAPWSSYLQIAATVAIVVALASATVTTVGRDWIRDQLATGAEGDRTLDPGQTQIMHVAVPGQSKVLAIGIWKLYLPANAFMQFDDVAATLGDRAVAVWVQQGRIDVTWESSVRQLGPGTNTAIGGGGNSVSVVEPATVLVAAPMIPLHEQPFAVGGGGQTELLAAAPYDESAGNTRVTVYHAVTDEDHALPQSSDSTVQAIYVESGTLSVTSNGILEASQEIATGETLAPGEGERITDIRGAGSGSATAFVVSAAPDESTDPLPVFYETTATLSISQPAEVSLSTRRLTLDPGASWMAEGDAAEVILVESGSPLVTGLDEIEYVLSEGSQIARNPGQTLEVRNLTARPIVLVSGVATFTSPEPSLPATSGISIAEGSSIVGRVPAGTYSVSLEQDTLDTVNGLAMGRRGYTGLANIDVVEGHGTVNLNDGDGLATPAAIHDIDAVSSFGGGDYWIEADPDTGMHILRLELILVEGDSDG